MRYFTNLFFLLFLTTTVYAQGPLITEFHYDDSYMNPQDSFEFVEVYLPDPQPAPEDLHMYRITLYQGTAIPFINVEVGDVHRYLTLVNTIHFGDTPNGAYYVVEFPDTTYLGQTFGGIENGLDGIAFSGPGDEVYKFLSYGGGSITAIEGPADGMTSDPITSGNGSSGSPVQENNSTATTRSLQQNGFDAWTYNVPFTLAAENMSNSETGFPGNVPVDMMYFIARSDASTVNLNWATAQEYDNDYFSILHSTDGRTFNEVGQVDGKGNYNQKSTYSFDLENVSDGTHYYKLRQVDFDGKSAEFEIRSVHVQSEDIITVMPSNTQVDIELSNVEFGQKVSIYDFQGKQVMNLLYDGKIDVSGLNNGMYIVSVNNDKIQFTKF